MKPLTFGSLFAGIGGMDLGLERAGMICKWQVEIDDYATKVLEKHWPKTKRHKDVRTFAIDQQRRHRVDVIAGGFPCQDVSHAGTKKGITQNTRSGLWFEFYRVIRTIRPTYILVENVEALLNRGLDRVLGDLATCGYDAEWQVLPACAFGAPQLRERVFIVAYSSSIHEIRRYPQNVNETTQKETHRKLVFSQQPYGNWSTEPKLDRVVTRSPPTLDRLRGLGNTVVPQVAEWLGHLIIAFEQQHNLREFIRG